MSGIDKTGGAMDAGRLLVREGLIRQEEVDRAMAIRDLEAEEVPFSLGRTLVKRGLVTREGILKLARHPRILNGAGELARKKGLVERARLIDVKKKLKPSETLGEVLVERGEISLSALKTLVLELLEGPQLGRHLVDLAVVTPSALEETQRLYGPGKSLGEVLCEMDLISPSDLYRVLAPAGMIPKLGELLIKAGRLEEVRLADALRRQEASPEKPLGRILVETSAATPEAVHEALARQCNVPFRKLAQNPFRQTQSEELTRLIGLDTAMVSGVLPVSYEGGRLTVAISYPENILSVDRLSAENPFLRIDPVLVSDAEFGELFAALYGNPPAPVAASPEAAAGHAPLGGGDSHVTDGSTQSGNENAGSLRLNPLADEGTLFRKADFPAPGADDDGFSRLDPLAGEDGLSRQADLPAPGPGSDGFSRLAPLEGEDSLSWKSDVAAASGSDSDGFSRPAPLEGEDTLSWNADVATDPASNGFSQLGPQEMNDVLSREAGGAAEDNVVYLPAMETVIGDPEREDALIQRMFRRYETLSGGAGGTAIAELDLFREFIRENHRRICNTFLCTRVTFHMENVGGRVLIEATPGAFV